MNKLDKDDYLTILGYINLLEKNHNLLADGVHKKMRIAIINLEMVHNSFGNIPEGLAILVKEIIENTFWEQRFGRGYIRSVFVTLTDICKRNDSKIIIL